jgi:S1-C subfamily serine protease
MRCGLPAMMIALLLGAGPALAQDPTTAAPETAQTAPKAIKKPAPKAAAKSQPAPDAPAVMPAPELLADVGWNVVVDPATGIRIGLPTKMVPQARDAALGTRWSSAHGDVQVETFRIKNPDITLSSLFERQKKEPAARRVEYSLLRNDSFIISGLQGLKKFTVRATTRDGEVRGFTMLYDQMMEGIVSPVMVAMASAFTPFPDASAPFAALSKSVEYGTGLVVSARGDIVTDLAVTQGCKVIVAAGNDAERIAEDKDSDLALLRVYGARALHAAELNRETPKTGDLTLIGIPDPKEQNGSKKPAEIAARLLDGAAIELRQPVPVAGFSGAAALDGQGRVLGIMQTRNAVLASTEPSGPPVRLITADTIRAFLAGQNIAPAAARPDANARNSVVQIICVRK